MASSINLLVLKFLTMNTDDERREEFSKNSQNFESSLLTNGALNGQTFSEATELEDLKKENSIGICLTSHKSFQGSFPCILMGRAKSLKTDLSCESFYTDEKCSNPQKLGGSIPTGLFNVKRKKSHYTIRRAPGKISHLLIQPREETNQVIESPRLFSNDGNTRSNEMQTQIYYFDCKTCKHSKELSSDKEPEYQQAATPNKPPPQKETFLNFFHRRKNKNSTNVDSRSGEHISEQK